MTSSVAAAINGVAAWREVFAAADKNSRPIWATSGGKMVWHKTIGNGPTKVIVIHGWFWDHRVFTPIFDCLDTASHTYDFVDIRGYGNSRNVSREYSIGEFAAAAIALACHLALC